MQATNLAPRGAPTPSPSPAKGRPSYALLRPPLPSPRKDLLGKHIAKIARVWPRMGLGISCAAKTHSKTTPPSCLRGYTRSQAQRRDTYEWAKGTGAHKHPPICASPGICDVYGFPKRSTCPLFSPRFRPSERCPRLASCSSHTPVPTLPPLGVSSSCSLEHGSPACGLSKKPLERNYPVALEKG